MNDIVVTLRPEQGRAGLDARSRAALCRLAPPRRRGVFLILLDAAPDVPVSVGLRRWLTAVGLSVAHTDLAEKVIVRSPAGSAVLDRAVLAGRAA